MVAVIGFCPILVHTQTKYQKHFDTSYFNLVQNLTNNIPAGVVIASPSRDRPNYYYHWVRDAGLTMREVIGLLDNPSPYIKKDRDLLLKLVKNWIEFEKRNQVNGGLGEPIFTVEGQVYPHPWGRPQNDGPAIRAIAMIEYTSTLIGHDKEKEIAELYSAKMPPNSLIKKDLEYISYHWQEPSFDLWEEVCGQHFFTKMAQRAALLKGAKLADQLNDAHAAAFYRKTAANISAALLDHRDPRGYIVPTIHYVGGDKNKSSGLDISVIIASIYFSLDDGFFSPNDQLIVNTANKIQQSFAQIYSINRDTPQMAPAIGRYPEDIYDGASFGEGNPWFLATSTMAEYYYRLSLKPSKASNDFKKQSLRFLDRIIYHSGYNGEMSEQYNRSNGYQQGANNLTWSYASYIRSVKQQLNIIE